MKRILSTCLSVVIVLGCIISASAADIEELEAKKAQLESEQAAYQAQLDEQNSAVTEQQKNVDAIVGKVQSVNSEISVIHEKIAALDTSISEKQGEIDTKNSEIETQMDTLRQRIKTIYISGDVSSLEIVLGAKDFSDFLDKIQLVQYVSDHDEELINGIKSQLEVISGEKAALQADKDEQETEQATLKTKQTELNTLLEENKDTLANLKLTAEETELKIGVKEDELAELTPELQQKYREQAQAAAQNNTPSEVASSDDGGSSESGGGDTTDYNDYSAPSSVSSDGGWVWPTPGCYYLTSTFSEQRSYEVHNAVDIGAGMGTPVYAASSGVVTQAYSGCTHNWGKSYGNWCSCGGGYGNVVYLSHDSGGYMTIYGHFSSITVSTGQHVSAGQLIGYVGSTGWSTGAHLHFEAHDASGNKIDPMQFY